MRERTKNEKWLVVTFFACVGLLLGYMVYTVATFNMNFDQWRASYMSRWAKRAQVESNDPLLLRKDVRKTVGKVDMVYRGIESDAIVIDYFITELDPDYSYHGCIPIEQAKRGFQLSSETFRLESAGIYSMQLAVNSDQ